MDFSFTEEQKALRKEFEAFFDRVMREAPEDFDSSLEGIYASDEGWGFHCDVARKLGEKGWLTLPWPKEYGGQAAPIIEQLIFSEVRGYYGAPGIDIFGLNMLAPTLMLHGTEEQKKEFLPPIAKGEVHWCQAWSEPNAGSDLASLTTRAVEDGDDYVLNGQKIWSTGAHRTDWAFTLARTNPEERRHRGLTYFLLNLRTPGVTIRPIPDMGGELTFNEIFFDDVRIPKRNMVGEKDRGWYITLATMNFERSGAGALAAARKAVEGLAQFAKEAKVDGKSLWQNPLIRHRLAQLFIEAEVGRAMCYRVAWMQSKGEITAHHASATKVYGSELGQRIAYTGCQIMGLYGQVKSGSKWAPFKGKFEASYRTCVAMNIAGGTSEIQRNIIATWGLELPREPR